MQDLITLFNSALSATGNTANVSDPDGQSREASICRLHYPAARKKIFGAFSWPELTAYERLALRAVRDFSQTWLPTNPTPGYSFRYAYPERCARPRYLFDYSRFEISLSETDEQVINANTAEAVLVYTKDVENPALWSSDLFDAVTYELAARINMSRSGKQNLTDSLRNQAASLIIEASVAQANSDDTYSEAIPAAWLAAGFAVPEQARYYYPTETYSIVGRLNV